MDKNHRYFLQVALCGSFKRAAEALYISQPSLTVAMKKLETDMGVTLFHRRPKGVELTEYGLLLKQYVQEQQDKQLQLMHRIQDMQQRQEGKIKLGTGEAWWELFVRQALQKYQIEQPSSAFHLEFGNNLSLVHHLVQGELDMVIGHEVYGLAEDARVSYRPLLREQEAVYVRAGHPLLATDSPQQQLAAYPLIRVTPNHARHQSVLLPEHAKQEQLHEQRRMQDRVCYDIDALSASIDILNMSDAVMPYTAEMHNWFSERGIETLYTNPDQLGNVGIYTRYGVPDEKIALFIHLIEQQLENRAHSGN
jgi:DNA-binding transcriptional LysR family regulator